MAEMGFQYREGLIEMLNGFGLAAAVRVGVHHCPAETLLDRWKVRGNRLEAQCFRCFPCFGLGRCLARGSCPEIIHHLLNSFLWQAVLREVQIEMAKCVDIVGHPRH